MTEILPLRCGTIWAPANAMEVGGPGDLVLPVYAYLITHPTGRMMLYDAGLALTDDGGSSVTPHISSRVRQLPSSIKERTRSN